MQPYGQLAQNGALADRYFQPLAGQSSSNDMYLVAARFVFKDNAFEPDAIGKECSITPASMEFAGPIIGDLLDGAGVSWSFYAEGYQSMVTARQGGACPDAPDACAFGVSIYPCVFDPGDVPIDYYANFRDNPRVLRDYAGSRQTSRRGSCRRSSLVRGLGFHSEHPGERTTISDGMAFVNQMIARDRVERLRSPTRWCSSRGTRAVASSIMWRRQRPAATDSPTARASR